jgi:hypothetical protein
MHAREYAHSRCSTTDFAVSQNRFAAVDRNESISVALQVVLSALHKVVGVILRPHMSHTHVIGHEVEHEPESSLLQPIAQPCQRRLATQRFVHCVGRDCEARASNVFVLEIGQRLRILLSPACAEICKLRSLKQIINIPSCLCDICCASEPVCHTLNIQIHLSPLKSLNLSRVNAGRVDLKVCTHTSHKCDSVRCHQDHLM